MVEIRELCFQSEIEERTSLLASRGLAVPGGGGRIWGAFDSDRLVGTASLIRSVVQGVAVDDSFEGEGLAASLLSRVISLAVSEGIGHLFLFTKPSEALSFSRLGFREIVSVQGASLLEWGSPGLDKYLAGLSEMATGRDSSAVVVNCNPFTLGHRWLLERASSSSSHLFVLVVEEDRSIFPFEDRFLMVSSGLSDLDNVTVIPSGPYVISSATFPTYFTKGGEAESVHASLDIRLFGTKIAPALGVSRRFVGSEPNCRLTALYNETMKTDLPPLGVAVEELSRIESGGVPISASRVRALLESGEMDSVRPLVPDVTWNYLLNRYKDKENEE
ncbi:MULTISPECIES: [citrate (pro-3S)-lyase] ligase [Dethiosulfovibrio]|uniref:[citrate (Pro-3S)-lyase] ligase n=2 Tax=Dethiosulfovibrio TaxID=47054 RepID=A0ABS9ENK6_9BACT|nr:MULTISPECIES: [citrate (pro-3S)-lyase] ligase [Dethiosulfovibrio]MCF4114030.1 [citrate (pro-3S)-lyase] ligase [Dethiosulfovibrio russensis]MCF4142780.1 [citrate (pro-3S)-lyase] ligase [Dethiosulfovibrio marinus]MCF4144656.1 [citrate (pro-3S)-lyase] ligase [Dethiosulfovibrio acidaminovorans]